jgi:sulfotransferase
MTEGHDPKTTIFPTFECFNDSMDFIDHLEHFDRAGRADMLFAKDKAIGAPLISLHAVPDLPKAVQERLYFLRFEDLVEKPAQLM